VPAGQPSRASRWGPLAWMVGVREISRVQDLIPVLERSGRPGSRWSSTALDAVRLHGWSVTGGARSHSRRTRADRSRRTDSTRTGSGQGVGNVGLSGEDRRGVTSSQRRRNLLITN
jgi:hypothetical protein